MDRKIYFYLVYITFFFLTFLFYDLSIYLTTSPLPTPAFLLYTPLTKYFFLIVILFATPIIFAILYVATRKSSVLASIIVYVIVLALFLILPIIVGALASLPLYVLLGLTIMALYIVTAFASEPESNVSKALWIISSFYLLISIIPAVSMYSVVLVLPSIVAAGIEALKLLKITS